MLTTWKLAPGDMIVRKSLHVDYTGRRQGGIGPATGSPNVFLFTDPNVGERHGYVDGWKADGCFHYTGEGQRGDQEIKSGNAAVLRHRKEGRALRLFYGVGGTVRYIGEFQVDEERPYYTTDAPETGGGPLRSVIVFRLRPVDISPQVPTGAPSTAENDTIANVPVEESQSERFFVEPDRAPYEAERREAKLVKQFCAYMLNEGLKASRIRVVPKGEIKPLFCDVYFPETGLLVEAKGSVERGAIRMALGQLLDYGRFLKPGTRAVLLPTLPREDLLALIRSAGVGVYFKTQNDTFSYIPP